LLQIYSGQCIPNSIRIDWVLSKIWQKHFGMFFNSQCIYLCFFSTLQSAGHPSHVIAYGQTVVLQMYIICMSQCTVWESLYRLYKL